MGAFIVNIYNIKEVCNKLFIFKYHVFAYSNPVN